MPLNANNHDNKLIPSGTRSWAVFRDGEMLTICERRSHAETILLALDALDSLPELNAENEALREQLEYQAVSA